jgi:hypothetical protein
MALAARALERDAAKPSPKRAGVGLILGAPRSGTSWVGKIADSHPDILYRHEPDIADPPPDLPVFVDPPPSTELQARFDGHLARWAGARDSRSAGSRPVFPKAFQLPLAPLARRAVIYAAKDGERIDDGLAARAVVPELNTRRPAARVLKSVNLLGRLPLVLGSPSVSAVVLVLRHPCAQVASGLRQIELEGRQSILAAADLPESPAGRRAGLSADDLARMTDVEVMAWKWLAFNDAALAATEADARVTVVRHESLAHAPDDGAQQVLAGLGLKPADQTKRFLDRSTRGGSTRMYSARRDPVVATSGWRRELSDDAVQRIKRIVAGSRPAAWYELMPPSAADGREVTP